MSDKQFIVTRQSPAVWRVTFNNPPLNIFGAESMAQAAAVVSAIESDEQLKVVIFDSAVDGFFMTHSDFQAKIVEVRQAHRHYDATKALTPPQQLGFYLQP